MDRKRIKYNRKLSLLWLCKMAWRDSRKNRSRLFLFISSIIFGIAAIVAIYSFRHNLQKDVDEQAATLLGADLVIRGNDSISTGSKGHSTPGGVFSILGKSKEYYSKKYNNAPMPHMQRLTDTGICMHSGNLPGYPASHGCIRMPFDFSQLLFSATAQGGTVVVCDGKVPVPHLASSPGLLLAPKDFTSEMLRPLAKNDYDWNPERSSTGPVTIVVSAADRALYVYRNGNPIGRAAVEINGRGSLGDQVYSLLEGTTDRQSSLAPGRAARRWMSVTSRGRSVPAEKLAERLRVNPEFANKVYDTIEPGTTVIITDQPVVRNRGKTAILEG